MKATRTQRPVTARKRILILDDHPITRYGLTQLINHEPDLKVIAEADNAPDLSAALVVEAPTAQEAAKP